MQVRSWAALSAGATLEPWTLTRREVGPHDVLIEVAFCGICHSDLHQVHDDWRRGAFPMVPGHEIVGRVARVGAGVTTHTPSDTVGVGCMVNSCRTCAQCQSQQQQFCEAGAAYTYNSTELDRATPTYGGYSTHIVVDEAFVLRVPAGLDPARAAPLLCAGITTFSPLRDWSIGPGQRVGVVGLGGLGHVGVKLAAAMGAEVTVLSTSPGKAADAKRLGAHAFALTTDAQVLRGLSNRFDFILDTVAAKHDVSGLFRTLRPHGTLALVGLPPTPLELAAGSLVSGARRFVGSYIGGIAQTQAMLDFCAAHDVQADVEVIAASGINDAWRRVLANDVRYRFVIDASTL